MASDQASRSGPEGPHPNSTMSCTPFSRSGEETGDALMLPLRNGDPCSDRNPAKASLLTVHSEVEPELALEPASGPGQSSGSALGHELGTTAGADLEED